MGVIELKIQLLKTQNSEWWGRRGTTMELRGLWGVMDSGSFGGKGEFIKLTWILSIVGYGYFLELLISCEIIFINI